MTFAFVSGNAALDLTGTVESRRDHQKDLLDTPASLERWMGECQVLPDAANVDTRTFASALELREAAYRLARDRIEGRPFTHEHLQTLNAVASEPTPDIELTDSGVKLTGDAQSMLAYLARDAIALLADNDAQLKECGRPECTRLYLDRSRGARRTWCGMKECGDRMKAAAYRSRKRASASPADVRV